MKTSPVLQTRSGSGADRAEGAQSSAAPVRRTADQVGWEAVSRTDLLLGAGVILAMELIFMPALVIAGHISLSGWHLPFLVALMAVIAVAGGAFGARGHARSNQELVDHVEAAEADGKSEDEILDLILCGPPREDPPKWWNLPFLAALAALAAALWGLTHLLH